MTKQTEKQLDHLLGNALLERPDFSRWFLGKTRFTDAHARCIWMRSNHPWGRSTRTVQILQTGTPEQVVREGETDILAVFETTLGVRLALHIENKRANGRFTPFQPELYAARAEQWKGKPTYQAYSEWDTVLVAPQSFYQRHATEARKFGAFISHEELAAFIPEFVVAA